MVLNDAKPAIQVDAETFEVTADGELLTCEPAEELPRARIDVITRGMTPILTILSLPSAEIARENKARQASSCTRSACS